MSQVSEHVQRNLHWRILRGVVQGLRVLAFLALCVSGPAIFVWRLIVSIIGVVTGSLSVLDVVPSLFGSVISYCVLAGVVGLALLVPMVLLERLLPPAYRPRNKGEHLPDGLPPMQANEELILAVPVQCLDPSCQALLDVRTGTRASLDPQTGKQVSPNAGYGGSIRLSGCFLAWLLMGGSALLVAAVHSDQTPVGKILMSLAILAGVAAYIASLLIAEKKQKAALARADRVMWCQCPRCRKWWIIRLDVHPQTATEEHHQGGEHAQS